MLFGTRDDDLYDDEFTAMLLQDDPAFREEVLYQLAMLDPVPHRDEVETAWPFPLRERDAFPLQYNAIPRIVEADPPTRPVQASKRHVWAWVALLALAAALFLFAGQGVPAPKPAPSCPASRVVCAPTLSADFINQVLTAYHSPVVGHGQDIYDEGVRYGIDPAYALAFFMHESSFGTAGEARVSLSIGNLRCIPTAQCRDGYAWFPTWDAGIDAWYRLIKDGYVDGAVSDHCPCTTIEQIIPVYAPSADQNNEGAYIQAVEHAVSTWRAGQVLVVESY